MSDFLSGENLLPMSLMLALLALFTGWLWYRRRAGQPLTLSGVLNEIAHERADHLVIPNGDDGEIQIDHLLLTAKGLLVIDIKDIEGIVFGSNKMDNWSVIGPKNRFQISNPQPGLYDRIAAIRHIIREVPVAGRILFLEGAEFSKGVPDHVCTLQQLHRDFSEADKAAAKFKVDAFRQHWETLQQQAVVPAESVS